MALFQGGAVPMVSVLPQFLGNTAGQPFSSINPNQISSLTNQVFQGSGQSFLARQGQSILSNSAFNFVNIGVSSLVNQEVAKTSGINLSSGGNFIASALTASVSPVLSSAININIANALSSAGPFGPLLSTVGSNLLSGAFNNVLSGLGLGNSTAGEGAGFSSISFPGAGDEPKADYSGGGPYTLKDIVFSLQPANQGPQTFGLSQAINDPKSATTVSSTQFPQAATLPNNTAAAFGATQNGKIASMGVTTLSNPRQFWDKGSPKAQDGSNTGGASNGSGEDASWTFITAPKNISWDINNVANRVPMFGTNNPPVVAGTKGMRELSVNEALVEGFVRNVTVEGKVRALEKLTQYRLNGVDGFVTVPVYRFKAESKGYGGAQADAAGFFVIKDVKVRELMRDLTGKMTRAYVDIALTEVPEYQVKSGRDIAGQATGGAKSALAGQSQTNATTAAQGATVRQQGQQQATPAGPGVNNKGAAAAATGSDAVIRARTPGANNFQVNGTGLGTLTNPTPAPTPLGK